MADADGATEISDFDRLYNECRDREVATLPSIPRHGSPYLSSPQIKSCHPSLSRSIKSLTQIINPTHEPLASATLHLALSLPSVVETAGTLRALAISQTCTTSNRSRRPRPSRRSPRPEANSAVGVTGGPWRLLLEVAPTWRKVSCVIYPPSLPAARIKP